MKTKQKWLLLLALVSILALALTFMVACDENEDDEEIPGVFFQLNDDGESYCVVRGEFPDGLEEITIPSTYNGKPVTHIEQDAFFASPYKKITISEGITTIGIHVFANSTALTTVVLPSTVTSIGQDAFAECTALTKIELPSTLTELDSGLFQGCSALTGVTIPNSVTTIGDGAFASTGLVSITIPSGVTDIGSGAFQNSALTSINIPDNVNTIGDYAFSGCENATNLTIGSGVRAIPNNAFEGCKKLTSVTIPDTVTSIGDYAFDSCPNLKTFTLGKGVELVGGNVFHLSDNLETVYWNAINVTSDTGLFENQYGLKELHFGSEVKSIPDFTFSYCRKLAEVNLPEGLVSIGESAFEYTTIATIVIPDSVQTIGDYAFSFCYKLYHMTLGQSVESIGSHAFHNCQKLVEVYNKSNIDLTDAEIRREIELAALHVYTVEYGSLLFTTEDGYVFFEGDEETYLVAYVGNETELQIPTPNGKLDTPYSVIDYAFYEDETITSIHFARGVRIIGTDAFRYCVNIESIWFPPLSDMYFYAGCFYGCSSLKSLEIHAKIIYLSDNAFAECVSLESITLDKVGGQYYSEGNCLINLGTIILGCKNSVIPTYDDVTRIGVNAFYGCTGLTSIVIPENITEIGARAFFGCNNLTSVVLPSTLTSIGADAFTYFDGGSLDKIYFSGTEEQWEKIVIDEGEEALQSTVYYYSESAPTVAGNFWHWKDDEPVIW